MTDKEILVKCEKYLLGLVFVLAALCVGVGAAAQPAEEADDAWRAERLGEPRSLEELVAFAEENAPQVNRARERLGLGEAAVDEASRLVRFNPELEGRLGLEVEEGGVAQYEVGLHQRFEVAGERGLRVDAAREESRVLEAEFERARWEVVQRVRHLYRLGLLTRRRVDIERRTVGFVDNLREITAERVEAGEEARTTLVITRAEHARARQRLVSARQEHLATLRELAEVIGWREDAPPRPVGELERAEDAPPRDELLEVAYEHDPELSLYEARRRQASAERALAEREVWPNPRVGLGFERERLQSAEPESKLMVLAGIPLPLWDRNQGEVGRATTRMQVFEQARDDREVVLKSRVFEQVEAVEHAREQAEIYEEEVMPAIEEQLGLLQEGFELGELSLLDVMDAQERLLEVQRQHLEALTDYYIAVSELERTVGAPVEGGDGE